MTTGTTNLDILELSIPSIEADEIHSGSAAAGAVLTADGNGGAYWIRPLPYIGDVSNNGDPPTNASAEAAFVATAGRASVFGDLATAYDSSGQYLIGLMQRQLVGTDLHWVAFQASTVTL